MFIASKNIKSILCIFTLLAVPMKNVLAMEFSCTGKIDKREIKVIEDIEFTARFTSDKGNYTDGVIVADKLPVNGGVDSLKFNHEMNWKYHNTSESVNFYHVTDENNNYYMLTIDHINNVFKYEEYNKEFGFLRYAVGEGNCTKVSD